MIHSIRPSLGKIIKLMGKARAEIRPLLRLPFDPQLRPCLLSPQTVSRSSAAAFESLAKDAGDDVWVLPNWAMPF
jgi:hypothetical protein